VIYNGIADHVHMLILLPPNVSASVAIQFIKANSSRWAKERFHKKFGWQKGFGAFSVPYRGQVVETWESTNTPFRIRVEMHMERGGFMPIADGAYYDFQSAAAGSDSWHEIMTFRYDDPIHIPEDKVHFADDKVASVFMGWMYAVTEDGGSNWRVSKVWDFLPKDERCLYNCIETLRIDANGQGAIKLNIIDSPENWVKIMETNDFGRSWAGQ
jgi:hypothetical protein